MSVQTPIALSLVMLLSISCDTLAQKKSDAASQDVKIRSMKQYTYKGSREGDRIEQGEKVQYEKDSNHYILYNAEGKELEKKFFNQIDSLTYAEINKYDERGNVIETLDYNRIRPQRQLKVLKKYNDAGLCVESTTLDMAGELREKYAYEYNDKGKLAVEKRLWNNNSDDLWVTYRRFEYDKEGRVVHVVPSPYMELQQEVWYIYDAHGNVTEYIHKDIASTTKEQYKYDKHNNKTEIRVLQGNNDLVSLTRHTYNAKNESVETVITGADKREVKVRNEYDAKGNLTKSHLEHQLQPDLKVNRTFTYLYTFDQKGNWTRKVSLLDDEPDYVVEREITYF